MRRFWRQLHCVHDWTYLRPEDNKKWATCTLCNYRQPVSRTWIMSERIHLPYYGKLWTARRHY